MVTQEEIVDTQIIIPMAGKSQRFFDAGYKKPKGLVEFFGLPMVGHILKIFHNFTNVLIIVNEDDYVNFDLSFRLRKLHPTVKIIKIQSHSYGPSYSILESAEFIDFSKKIIVHYCDFSGVWDPYETVRLLNTYDGVFLSFKGFHPTRLYGTKFAYGRTNGETLLIEIKEKGSFTSHPEEEHASSGIYGFSTGKLLLESISEQIKANLQINGEFYTSLTQQTMLCNDKKIVVQNMDLFYGWGTPEDLETYIYYLDFCITLDEYINTDKFSVYHNGVILAAGKSSRLKLEGTKPKQSKIILGKTKLMDFSKSLISKKSNTFLVATLEAYPLNIWDLPNENMKILTHASESQISSIQFGINLIKDKKIPISFLASDNIIILNDSHLSLESNADLIVWVKSNYPFAKINPEQYSWVRVNDDNTIEEVIIKEAPKKIVGWKLMTGNFTFRNHAIVCALIDVLENEAELLRREPLLDDLVGVALKMGYSIRAIEVAKYITLGNELENKVFDFFSGIHKYDY